MRSRRAVAAVIAAAVVAAGLAAAVTGANAATEWKAIRVAGEDRYATAAAVSQRWFPSGADTVYVASGETFADSLAAGSPAARASAPLLLTRSKTLPEVTVNELRRLAPSRIVLVGGAAAVSDAVAWMLGYIAPVTRVFGADRFETSARLSATTFTPGAPVAFVASGSSFPDALAAGAAAGRLGGPVLLASRDLVTTAVTDELARLRPRRVVIVGGTAAISTTTGRRVGATERIGGADRYDTAARLAASAPDANTVFVSSGTSFADALTAAPTAARADAPVLLTAPTCMPTPPAVQLGTANVDAVYVIGGTAAVADTATAPCDPAAVDAAVDTATTTTSTTSTSTTSTSTTTTTTTPPNSTTTTRPASTSTTQPPTLPAVPRVAATAPAIDDDAPDPTIIRVTDVDWYAYSTQSWRNPFFLAQIPVWHSADSGRTWTFVDDGLPQLPAWATWGNTWAPSITKVDDTYVLWFAATDTASNRQCLSWATSTSPTGPFGGGPATPAICQTTLGGSIDADVFTDTDGARYLYWKTDENALETPAPSHIWAQRLAPDATTLRGTPTVVLAQNADWEQPTMEGPSVVRHDDTYYLFFSAGWWESADYGTGYATASSPLGPFTKQTVAAPWLATRTGASGPGGLDVFAGPDGQPWAAYHAWPDAIGYTDDGGGRRALYLTQLGW
jgi:putative cell wall-binding protein